MCKVPRVSFNRLSMIFRSYKPSIVLHNYVEVIHLRHFIFHPDGKIPYKPYPPRPEHCITFYVRGFETTEYKTDGIRIQRPRSTISGQYTHQINRNISAEFLMILVVFKPGALNRIIKIPFSEFINQAADAEAVLGRDVRCLNQRLASMESYDDMISQVTLYLENLVRKSSHQVLPFDSAMDLLLHNKRITVKEFSALSCLSTRQLERRFLERIGTSPKTFLRIFRFNHSYFTHLRLPSINWQTLASHCGYTDYQHMVKDYREFTGSTPAHLFASESQAPERVLGLTK